MICGDKLPIRILSVDRVSFCVARVVLYLLSTGVQAHLVVFIPCVLFVLCLLHLLLVLCVIDVVSLVSVLSAVSLMNLWC